MVGGQKFFDRLEIKVLLDYLRVISQPANNDALARVINVPLRGIGPATIKALLEAAETASMTLWNLIRNIIQGGTVQNIKISKQANQGLGSLFRIILFAKNKLSDANDPYSPELLLRYLTVKLDFERHIKKNYEQDYDTRWANVEELFAQASDYEVLTEADLAHHDVDSDVLPDIEGIQKLKTSPSEETLSKFLANVALATEIQREEESEDGIATPQCRVTISTMHAAKGLEWPVVFIPSAYEGSIPHSRAEDTNEERRLLYVAMTRAQALLYISCPTKNSQRGS
jgi:DNA helicase-2/ATP-dependent DNA helicase PcrA